MQVNQQHLAEIFGVSDVTVREWQKEGMPHAAGSIGTAHQYDTAACIEWLAARRVARAGVASPRDELTRLQVEEKRLDLAERNKELVRVDQIAPIWESRIFAAANFLSGQHSRIAGMLDGTPSMEGRREILREVFAQFLTHLGVHGERMQSDVEFFLEQLPAGARQALRARLDGEVPPP